MSNSRYEDCVGACGMCIWLKLYQSSTRPWEDECECMNDERRKQKDRGDFFGEMPGEKIDSDPHSDDEIVGCPFKDEDKANFPSVREPEWDDNLDR